MSPWKILIFFISVFGMLLILSIVIPKEGIRLGEEVNLRFASAADLFAKDSTNSHYTDSLIRHATVTDDPEFGKVENAFALGTSPSAGTPSSAGTLSSAATSPAKGTPGSSGTPGSIGTPSFPGTFSSTAAPSPAGASSFSTAHSSTAAHSSSATPPSAATTSATISPGIQTNTQIKTSTRGSATSSALKNSPDRSTAASTGNGLTRPKGGVINMDSIIRARIDSIRDRVYPIEYPMDTDPGLYAFFEEAERSQAEGRLLRILHYGDSQIENDRMTALLRNRFQQIFGGSGCGMVPAIPLYHGNPTFRQKYGGDWIRYTGFGRRDTSLEHSCFGMMACFTSIPMPHNGTLPYLEFSFLPGRLASRFSEMKIYLHSYVDGGMIMVHYNDTISDTIFNISDGYQEIGQVVDFDADKVRLEFNLRQGGRIYGISFDPDAGIQMDNIAMRGSSGLEFSRSDPVVLDTMLEAVDPGLIIMQFGGNVVPFIHNYDFYKRRFTRELNYLRSMTPGSAIVVIGPGDMSTKDNGRFVTYNALEPVRDALRDAAHDTGCAFWDMYAAMGGRNSIQDFVLANPPLASTDYIHFTPRGANLMAGMFFDAMMLEYGKYKAEKQLAANQKAIRTDHTLLISGNPGVDLSHAVQK